MIAQNIATALQVMWQGMAGIFIVTAVIVLSISLLSRIPDRKPKETDATHRGHL